MFRLCEFSGRVHCYGAVVYWSGRVQRYHCYYPYTFKTLSSVSYAEFPPALSWRIIYIFNREAGNPLKNHSIMGYSIEHIF